MSKSQNHMSDQPLGAIPKALWIGGAVILLLSLVMGSEVSDPTPEVASECQFSDVQPEIDAILASIQKKMSSEILRVSGCNDFADLLSKNYDGVDTDLVLIPRNKSCTHYNTAQAKKYLLDKADTYRVRADQICGPGLDYRIKVGQNRTEFTEILSSATAGEAARKIGSRIDLFAPDFSLRRCLETAGIRDEPAVMAQPFVTIVASCEIMLGISPQRPNARWRLPSVDDPLPEADSVEITDQQSDASMEVGTATNDVQADENTDEPDDYYYIDEQGNLIGPDE